MSCDGFVHDPLSQQLSVRPARCVLGPYLPVLLWRTGSWPPSYPPTYEKRQRAGRPLATSQLLCTVLFTPVYLALLVASLPFAFLGFLPPGPHCSLPLRPYIYSRLEDKGPWVGRPC